MLGCSSDNLVTSLALSAGGRRRNDNNGSGALSPLRKLRLFVPDTQILRINNSTSLNLTILAKPNGEFLQRSGLTVVLRTAGEFQTLTDGEILQLLKLWKATTSDQKLIQNQE